MPGDLYSRHHDHGVGWMIVSGKNTGSKIHTDPDLMGAWNLLLTGDTTQDCRNRITHSEIAVVYCCSAHAHAHFRYFVAD